MNRFYSNFSNVSDVDTDDVGKLRRRCIEAEALADALKVELNDLKQQHAHVIEKNKDYEEKMSWVKHIQHGVDKFQRHRERTGQPMTKLQRQVLITVTSTVPVAKLLPTMNYPS